MGKLKAILALGAVVLVAALAYSAWANFESRGRIAQLEAEKKALEETKKDLEKRDAENLAREARLETEVNAKQKEVETHLTEVASLKAQLADAHVQQFVTARPSDYRQKIAEFWPEMAGSDWGVYQALDENGLKANYLRVPLGMADAFMFNARARRSAEAQNEQLTEAFGLQRDIIGLKDEIVTLEKQRADAWKQGFDTAFTAFSKTNDELRQELGRPRFNVELPKRGALVGTALLGLILGGL